MELIGLMFAPTGGYAAMAVGVVVALAVAFFKGRSSGIKSERAKQDRATIDIVKDHKDTAEEVERLPSDTARDELSRWSKS